MDKEQFMQKLSEKTGLSLDQCGVVNDILGSVSKVGNKDEIVALIKEKLNLPDEVVDNVYNAAMSLVAGGFVDKIKGLFDKD